MSIPLGLFLAIIFVFGLLFLGNKPEFRMSQRG
jgi:hypothetical protein